MLKWVLMRRDIYLHSLQSVLPLHHLTQAQTNEWIFHAHTRSAELIYGSPEQFPEKLRRFVLNEKHISQRYFECDDVDEDWESHSVYRLTQESPQGVSIGERNRFFNRRVMKVLDKLYANSTPEHVVHVTCTGYVSPSPVQAWFSTKEKAPSITHAYHMGCYASLPAVRMAMGLHHLNGSEVDILHTEMCSLHLDPSLHTPEQMVVQSLFADGHIRYAVGSERRGLKILGIKEKIIPDTKDDMTWIPDSFGMKMTLSREVPLRIRDALPAFFREFCEECEVNLEDILKHAIFAIHPGGPSIIDAVQKKLELNDDQVETSRKILFERGNMSSATLPHVWKEIVEMRSGKGKKVVSLAFGPGLTVFASLFEVV